jgi:dienelactone hydrolase
VAVQAGEGTEDIIYGSTSVPAGPRVFGGYLARPDGEFEWPTVLVYGPSPSPTSSIKNVCRVLARHGIAALSPDLTGEPEPDRRIGRAIANFIGAPNGDWSNAEYGFGVVAFGSGTSAAARLAATDGRVVAIAIVGSSLDDDVVDDLAAAGIPVLYIGSRGDEDVDIEGSVAQRERIPLTTFVVYADGEHGFWNDDAPGFRPDRFDDVVSRLVAFLESELPVRI